MHPADDDAYSRRHPRRSRGARFITPCQARRRSGGRAMRALRKRLGEGPRIRSRAICRRRQHQPD